MFNPNPRALFKFNTSKIEKEPIKPIFSLEEWKMKQIILTYSAVVKLEETDRQA